MHHRVVVNVDLCLRLLEARIYPASDRLFVLLVRET
jgi:hypothetical protein